MYFKFILLLCPLGLPSEAAKRQDVNVDLQDLSLSQFIAEASELKTQESGKITKSAIASPNMTLNEKQPLRTEVVREKNKKNELDFHAPQDKPPLTAEQRLRMEENRKMAIKKKNLTAVEPPNMTLYEKQPLRSEASIVKVVREKNNETELDFQAPQDKPPLTAEQRLRMEENRNIAIKRKNLFQNHSSNTCPPYLTENKSTMQKKFRFKPVKRPANKENVTAVQNLESDAEQSLEDTFDRNEEEWNKNPRYNSGVPKEKKTKDAGNGSIISYFNFVSFIVFKKLITGS